MDYDQYMQNASTVGDSLYSHRGNYFTTLDRDNDVRTDFNCASVYGGFWDNECQRAGLNNHYSNSSDGYGDTEYDRIWWHSWHGEYYSLKATKIMIRPID